MEDPDTSRSREKWPIEPERFDCGSPLRSSAQSSRTISAPAEVRLPLACPRIEERYRAACSSIESLDPRLFVAIAPKTTPAQIPEFGRSAMRLGNHVIDRKFVSG
jgi:hypothetical protein